MDPNFAETATPIPFLQNKKRLLLVGVVAGIFVVGMVLLVILSPKAQKQEKQTTSTSSQSHTPAKVASQKISTSPYTLTSPFNPQTAPLHKDTDYSMQYPRDWRSYTFPIHTNTGGSLFEIFPNVLGKNDGYYPRLDIYYYYSTESASIALQQRVASLLTNQYTKSADVVFHGYQAKKLWGPLKLHIVDTNPPQNRDLYKTYYVFVKDHFVYLVDYAYDGLTPNTVYEKYFADILSTLTFNPTGSSGFNSSPVSHPTQQP